MGLSLFFHAAQRQVFTDGDWATDQSWNHLRRVCHTVCTSQICMMGTVNQLAFIIATQSIQFRGL